MRLSFEHNTEAATPRVAPDSSAPDLGVLMRDTAAALQSFFSTVDRVIAERSLVALEPQAPQPACDIHCKCTVPDAGGICTRVAGIYPNLHAARAF